MRYLLDTNILSALVRSPGGSVADRIKRTGDTDVYTSAIVAAEHRFGAAWKGSERLALQIDEVLAKMSVEAWQVRYDRVYADLRTRLGRAGTPIGANDLLIGAQALSDGSVLVTDNVREVGRIAGLRTENWLQR